ncbi:hypothetical protein E2C01_002535 [Portunus trituberculatus]|uniref:Uncharacterized protein n=1 Tax=Portunus trituberculatus TaxID=210409 RepID=A0A5B7CNH8_PORTR|nr:hypothetical protein [Portunus trituberculatus]
MGPLEFTPNLKYTPVMEEIQVSTIHNTGNTAYWYTHQYWPTQYIAPCHPAHLSVLTINRGQCVITEKFTTTCQVFITNTQELTPASSPSVSSSSCGASDSDRVARCPNSHEATLLIVKAGKGQP